MNKDKVVVELIVDEEVDEHPLQAETGLEPLYADHAHQRGIVLILAAVVCFATMDSIAKYLNRHYPAPGLVFARYFGHMLLMLIVLGPRMKWDLLRTRSPKIQILRGLLLAGSTTFFFFGLRALPLAEAAAIGFISPLLVTAMAVPLLGEKVSRRRWVAVGLGFLGVVVIVRPGGGLLTPSAVFPVCSAMCFATYQILTRKLSRTENPYATLFYTAIVGALVMLFALPFGWKTPTGFHIPLVLMLGLLGGTGHFMMIRAFSHAPASVLAPFVYSHLVWAMLLGFLVFGEFPDGWSFIGMLIIVGSGLFVAYGERLHLHRVR